jgi:hypothetical protein
MGGNFFIEKNATHIDTVERDEKKSQTRVPIIKSYTPSSKMFKILRFWTSPGFEHIYIRLKIKPNSDRIRSLS